MLPKLRGQLEEQEAALRGREVRLSRNPNSGCGMAEGQSRDSSPTLQSSPDVASHSAVCSCMHPRGAQEQHSMG